MTQALLAPHKRSKYSFFRNRRSVFTKAMLAPLPKSTFSVSETWVTYHVPSVPNVTDYTFQIKMWYIWYVWYVVRGVELKIRIHFIYCCGLFSVRCILSDLADISVVYKSLRGCVISSIVLNFLHR